MPTEIEFTHSAHRRPLGLGTPDPVDMLFPDGPSGLVLIFPASRTRRRRALPAAALEEVARSALLEVAARRGNA